MGKLVLGILFVILLQVVFFGYTSRYWSASEESAVVKARPSPAQPRPAPGSQLQALPVTDPAEPSAAAAHEKRDTPADARQRVRPKTESRDRIRRIRTREERFSISASAPGRTSPESEQLSSVAPRRYVVVVSDDLPAVRPNQTADAPKQKKRSLLAKSFSIVVKKPWGWMKSLASKLN